MARLFSITEPHPSVPRTGGYIYGGRGGAGNYKHYQPNELTAGPGATGPASRVTLPKNSQRPVLASGRGGVGNMTFTKHNTATEESIFQFDEELLTRRETHAPVYHIGRGGAANWVDESKPRTECQSSSSSASTASSADSTNSTASVARRSAERAMGLLVRRSS